jgi:carboxyl-terminal processing protease
MLPRSQPDANPPGRLNASQRSGGARARLLALGVSVVLLTLASFGLGFSLGAQRSSAQAAGPVPAQEADAAVGASRSVDDGAGNRPVLDVNLFREAWGLLQKQFYGDLPSGADVTYDAIRGVIDRLGDEHTSFLDPKSAAQANADIQGQFEGIGCRVSLAEGGGVLISYLFAEQPAEQAGLLVGDIITGVDGQDVTHLSLTEATGLIRGPHGTRVTLTMRREGRDPFDVTITRARIEVPVTESRSLGDGRIAYISLSEFTGTAPARVAAALQAAVAQEPAGIVFDLRGNPGGFLDAAVTIGSYFVPAGKVPGDNIVIERFKDGAQHSYPREGDYLLRGVPLVVLVDGGSASASEIVAGAIQDAGTGVLIGDKTYGKGSVQLINALSDGSQMRITVAHWFTPRNRGIQDSGLAPDLTVALTKEDAQAKRDPQLDRAVAYLLGTGPLATPLPTATLVPGPATTPTP